LPPEGGTGVVQKQNVEKSSLVGGVDPGGSKFGGGPLKYGKNTQERRNTKKRDPLLSPRDKKKDFYRRTVIKRNVFYSHRRLPSSGGGRGRKEGGSINSKEGRRFYEKTEGWGRKKPVHAWTATEMELPNNENG